MPSPSSFHQRTTDARFTDTRDSGNIRALQRRDSSHSTHSGADRELAHLMAFNEANTVEQMILDAVSGVAGVLRLSAQQQLPMYAKGGKAAGWKYFAPTEVPRNPADVMVEAWVREALVTMNPEIAERPDRADEVIYALRACILSVQSDGLV